MLPCTAYSRPVHPTEVEVRAAVLAQEGAAQADKAGKHPRRRAVYATAGLAYTPVARMPLVLREVAIVAPGALALAVPPLTRGSPPRRGWSSGSSWGTPLLMWKVWQWAALKATQLEALRSLLV